MEKVVTFIAEDHCFPLSGYHCLFPCLFPFHIFELSDVMHFEGIHVKRDNEGVGQVG